MSLPPAPKDISEHPIKGSVVEPADKHAKDADIGRKIRFYGVISALRQGRFPSNQQLHSAIRYLLKHSPVETKDLSSEGKKLVQDIRDILETAGLIIEEKNADELIQQFLWHTRDIDNDALDLRNLQERVAREGEAVIDPETIKSEAEQAIRHLRTVLTLILTNSEVRKLLFDFSLIGRDLLARSASQVAGTVAPPEEKLKQVDQPAPEDAFQTAGGRTVGLHETPVLEARLPGTGAQVRHHPREDEPVVRSESGAQKGLSQLKEEGVEAKEAAQSQARDVARDTQADVREGVHRAQAGDEQAAEERKGGFMDKVRDFRDNITDRLPQQRRDETREQYERGRKFLSEEYFPEERRDQFIFRGKKVIIECQKHDDYQQSMRWLLDYFKEYLRRGKDVSVRGQDQVATGARQTTLQQCISEFRTILERFADGRSLDVVLDSIDKLADDARRDESLRAWFRSLDAYLRRVLLEPGYILLDECDSQGTRLKEDGRKFYDDTYRAHFDDLFNSVSSWFRAMSNDPVNVRFSEDWARLTKDLLFDSEGSLAFKAELWNDVRKIILPQLIDKVGYIPIPRVEYSDESLDLVVENLTLTGRNLFPNVMSVEAHNFFRFSPYNAFKDQSNHRLTLTLGQMQADMRDVAFYFRKKTGIAKLKDSGLADVVIGGEGLTVTAVLTSSGKDRSSVFHVHDVHVKVDTLKFSIRDSKHDLLYKTLKPLATGLVKRQIVNAVSDAVKTGLEYLDGQLVSVRDKVESARATEDENRGKVLQDLFQRKQSEVSLVTSGSKLGTGHFHVVSSKRDSLLSSAGHPSGWVNRTADRDELAVTGSEWRSEAFNIV